MKLRSWERGLANFESEGPSIGMMESFSSMISILCSVGFANAASFGRRMGSMGIAEVLTAPPSPWQNPFDERLSRTIRRELLDHLIVLNKAHLRRRLRSYLRYSHGSRTHLALEKDAPEPRAVEPPEHGRVVALPHAVDSISAVRRSRSRRTLPRPEACRPRRRRAPISNSVARAT